MSPVVDQSQRKDRLSHMGQPGRAITETHGGKAPRLWSKDLDKDWACNWLVLQRAYITVCVVYKYSMAHRSTKGEASLLKWQPQLLHPLLPALGKEWQEADRHHALIILSDAESRPRLETGR